MHDDRFIEGDAFGSALVAHLDEGQPADRDSVVERDDGFIDPHSLAPYFSAPGTWGAQDDWAVARVRGRVLDVGAGAGRHTLALQDAGHDVVALDVSPGALEVCKRRGVRSTFLGTVEDLAASDVTEPFDSIVMLGNNLGLLGGAATAPSVLRAMAAVTRPGARLIGTALDPHVTDNPAHLAVHEANRSAGRLPGHVRIRVRYRDLADPWFDYCHVSLAEADALAAAAGWHLVESDGGSPLWAAMWERP